jgi:hypothetical protein
MRRHKGKTIRQSWLFRAFLLVLIGVVWAGDTTVVRAINNNTVTARDWVRPQRIPGHGPESSPPVLVADQDQTVHTFSSQPIGDKLVIVYSQWTPERGWTMPTDILLPAFKRQARLASVVLDEAGTFHMVFFSGDDLEANIYYTRAPAIHAGRATAWSLPVNVGPNAIVPQEAELILLENGQLILVYAGRLYGQGLYAVDSHDQGETWSTPEPIFLTYDNGLWPTPLELYEDSSGRLHALWGLANYTGNRQAIYYARLDSPERQWNTATLFAEAIDFEANTPAIMEHGNQLIALYNNNMPTTRWTRRSFDGGDTWTDPVRVSGHVGTNGPPFMIELDNGVLHMFFANRIGNPAIHGVWYTIWQENEQRWRVPEPIVSGPGGRGFDPQHVQATLVQGNVLLLTWVTDPSSGRNGVWYTYTRLDAPPLPRQPLPEPTPTPTPTPTPHPCRPTSRFCPIPISTQVPI